MRASTQKDRRAFWKLTEARKSESAGRLRQFRVPDINYETQSYGHMIPWETRYINDDEDTQAGFITSYSEPPVISDISEDGLRQKANEGKVPEAIYGLPNHNQDVERAIKLVSHVSHKASRKEDREVIILASRSELPNFETEKQFKVKWNHN